MNEQLDQDLKKIEDLLEQVKKYSISYLHDLETSATSVTNPTEVNYELPEIGLGGAETLKEFDKKFRSVITASSSSRYWGYVTGGTTPASIMGDWLTSVFDQNTQNTKGQGDISAIIETETIKLLLKLFELPESFIGGFVSGATMSNFTCLAVARQWVGKQLGKDIAKEGLDSTIKIISATPHSSSIKSLSMLGIGSNNIIIAKTIKNREAIDTEDLELLLKENKNHPIILISSGGTVNTGDFDNMNAIAELKKNYNFWWHIDAAFGAFAACSEKYKFLVSGWEGADSITIDCHKWLNVPYDSAIYLTKESHSVLQIETFQNSNAPYLGNPLENFSFLNFLPENSRRFRALPAWFTLMAYGKEGYREIVENNITLAQKLGAKLSNTNHFELQSPPRLNVVCFTLKYFKDKPEKIYEFVKKVNERGIIFITPTIYKGTTCARAALVNWRTNKFDIQMAFDEFNKAYMKIDK